MPSPGCIYSMPDPAHIPEWSEHAVHAAQALNSSTRYMWGTVLDQLFQNRIACSLLWPLQSCTAGGTHSSSRLLYARSSACPRAGAMFGTYPGVTGLAQGANSSHLGPHCTWQMLWSLWDMHWIQHGVDVYWSEHHGPRVGSACGTWSYPVHPACCLWVHLRFTGNTGGWLIGHHGLDPVHGPDFLHPWSKNYSIDARYHSTYSHNNISSHMVQHQYSNFWSCELHVSSLLTCKILLMHLNVYRIGSWVFWENNFH